MQHASDYDADLRFIILDLLYCDVSSQIPLLLQVNLPGHICAVVVTTLVLEGWSSKLDPGQSIMDDIKTVTAYTKTDHKKAFDTPDDIIRLSPKRGAALAHF